MKIFVLGCLLLSGYISTFVYAADCTYAGGLSNLGSGLSNPNAGLLTGYSNCSGPINVTCQNGTFYDNTNSQSRSSSEVYISVLSCTVNTQNNCIYANGGSPLPHLSTNSNAALSSSACIVQALYCDNGYFLDHPGHTTSFNSSSVYSSVGACQNPSGQSCGPASSGASSSYPLGLYTNQRNDLYQSSGTMPLFCSTGSVQGGFTSVGATVNRGCSLPLGSLSCSNIIRSNQPMSCGVSPTAGLTSVSLGTGGSLCVPGGGHNDPSIVSNIVINSVSGGGVSPWNRTCGGLYHSGINCTAQSQGLCGSDGSGSNQSFLSLSSTSPNLCTNGVSSGFTIQPITSSSFFTARYNWNCIGSASSYYQSCVAYQTPTPSPGLCNAGINGQSLVYSQIQNALLCTQGVPSVTLVSPIPNSGSQWTRTCLGLGGASSVNCSVNAITNGICTTYPTAQSTQPTNLCVSGVPTGVSIINNSYTWLCNGTNGGVSSPLCSASCTNGQCSTSTTTTGTNNGGTTTTGTNNGGTTTTGSNGIPTPVSINQLCNDIDGCICYNVTIVNGSRCLSNNLTGTTDSILSPISLGESCLDADGCICNSLNSIVNGSVCQTDGLTGVLPGSSDLIISQTITSGSITRRGTVEITISYFNRGPNTATGSTVEYYISPLVSKFRTSAPYTLKQVSNSGYIESSEYQSNVLVFPIGELQTNEDGKIKIELTLTAGLSDTEVVNSTSIASRVRDPKPLDNAQKLLLSFETQKATTLGITLINPFLGIQKIVNQYDIMNKRLRIDPIFDDVQRGDDDYMPIMTVVRNGIFEGYRYKFSRSFGGEKCTSRIEAINVIAKMMYTAGSTDVYTSRQKGTAYIDTNSISSQSQNFVNRAHERGLLKILSPKSIRGSLYLEPHREITQGQIKQIIYAIYQRYGLDPSIVESLLTDETNCTTRGELAYVMAQILRGNPNIMMGYNDEFLKQVVTKTSNLTIAQRRLEIKKIIDKLKITEPSVLSANGYDAESLVGILEAAMAGREYNPVVDLTSASNFLYQQRQ